MKYTLAMFLPEGGSFKLPTPLIVSQPFDRCISCEAERVRVAHGRIEYRCGCCLVRTTNKDYAVLSCCPYAMAAVSELRTRRIMRFTGRQLSQVPAQLLGDLKIGTKVRWVSQSAGKETSKQGVIVAVVPANVRPENCIPKGLRKNSTNGYGKTRDHKSYLVQVAGKGTMVYWPRVFSLECVQ